MVRLAEILKRQELERTHFYEHRPVAEAQLTTNSVSSITAEQLYKQLLSLMRQILLDILNGEKFDFALLKGKLDLLSDFISKDKGSLLRQIDRYDNLDDYLVVHGVNVCILSLEIARGLNYNREEMADLGLGAFLHDAGMIRLGNILENKRRLFTAEYDEVKNHVIYGVELLKEICPLNDRIFRIISEHHERRDGSGYLKGLKGSEIDEYAQIVGLADVYEALIHSRPHRNRFVPFEYETIRELISNKALFEPYILRVFLERLTHNPSYLLWLTTDGIYELLQQHRLKLDSSDEPEVKTLPSPKRNNLALPITFTLLVLFIGITILFKFELIMPPRIFYPLGSSLSITDNRQPLKIVYNFTDNISNVPAVSLDLSEMNLQGYQLLTFSAKLDEKKINKIENATLGIVIENTRKETAHYYLKGIDNKWREFRIPFYYFGAIKDWSAITTLSFMLQPWNISSKEGTLYIDRVRFFRKR